MSDENFNPDAPLHIRGLNHLTIPVKQRYRAARFYIVALGAEAHHESAPDRVAKGLSRSLFSNKSLANPTGTNLILMWLSILPPTTWRNGPSISINGRFLSSAQ